MLIAPVGLPAADGMPPQVAHVPMAITATAASTALDDLQHLPVRRVPHVRLLPRCWELRRNLSIYDAVYVALAEALDLPLLTADRRLARAPGIRCDVEVLTS